MSKMLKYVKINNEITQIKRENMNKNLIKYYQNERRKPIEDIVLFYGSDKVHNRDLVAVYEQLKIEQPDVKLVWVVRGEVPSDAMVVNKGDEEYYYYLARARFIIANDRIDSAYLKRKIQRFIQIKPLAIQPIGLELDVNQEFEEYRNRIVARLEDARRWSFIATSSEVSYEIIRDAFAIKEKRVIGGQPSFDYIFKSEELYDELKVDNPKVLLVDFKHHHASELEGLSGEYQVFDLNAESNYTKEELKLMSDIYITDHLENTVEMANFKQGMIFVKDSFTEDYRFEIESFFPGIVVKDLTELPLINEITVDEEKLEEFNEVYNMYSSAHSATKIIAEAKIKTYRVKHPKLVAIKNRVRAYLVKKYNKYLWQYSYTKMRDMKIQDKTILFESFLGRNYSDNPKAIYEYMYQNYPDYKYVFALDNPKAAVDEIPGNAILVKRFGVKYVYYLAVSKYIVTNSRMSLKYKKRDEQVYIQTWHGTPLKKLVMDMQNVNMPGTNKQNYLINFLNEAKRWDYLISANAHSTKVFNSAFLQENMLEVGYPRNDILVNATEEYIAELRSSFDFTSEDKVLLYAPTFRDDEYISKGNYTQKIELDLERIHRELPEWKILLRTHYLVTENMDLEIPNVINVSDYHDINHLYLVADVLMTDYSSVFFDYAILDRPMVFYAYDLEKYESDLRGFYFDYESTIPGKNISGTKELIEILSNIEDYEANYQAKREKFRQEFTSLETGEASKKIAELIVNNQL